jgi:quinol monooxygenase YgiN
MAFIQIMDLRTSKFDDVKKLDDQWRNDTEGKRTLQRSVVARDRNDPEHYVVLAFFESPESAMKNSNLPETSAFAEKIAKLASGPIQFTDFDVVIDDED